MRQRRRWPTQHLFGISRTKRPLARQAHDLALCASSPGIRGCTPQKSTFVPQKRPNVSGRAAQ